MATLQEREVQIQQIKQRNSNILSLDIENNLVKRTELGSLLNFEEVKNVFLEVFDLVKKVDQCELTKVPYASLVNYNNHIGTIENILTSIKNFDVNSGNPTQTRTSLIQQIQGNLDALMERAVPILTVNLLSTNDLSIEKAKVQSLLSEVVSEKDNLLSAAQAINSELKETLDSAKRAAAQVGVAQHSLVFKEEAEFHSGEARKWMYWTIGILIATGAAGIAFLFWMPKSVEGTSYLIQFTITKVVVLAVFFYALSICIKNYRAHKHNAILNKHRQNALSTFETFVKGSTDDQTKNAVLLQTTMSIFANQQTGYSSSDNDGDMPSKVIEIIKSSGSLKSQS